MIYLLDTNVCIKLNLGNAYKNLKEYKKAIIYYTKAIVLNPNYTSAYNNRGVVYKSLKEYKQAKYFCGRSLIL